jgi:hypothetical protein
VSELEVSRAFAAALGHADFEATSNLFAVGGNSLMAAQIAEAVAGGRVDAVYRHASVRSLASFLSSEAAGRMEQPPSGDSQLTDLPSQQQQQQPPFAVRQLAVSGSGADGDVAAGGRLALAWRAKLDQCVDAAPVFGCSDPAPAANPAQQKSRRRIFACSHGGDVCCMCAESGERVWEARLPGPTDAGLALCRSPGALAGDGGHYVAVPTNAGALFFLRAADGGVAGSVDTGGGIRAAPALDPWRGLVWQPTHGRRLLVVEPPGRVAAQLELPAAASAPVTFNAAQHAAFVCCLDGSLLGVATEQCGAGASSGDLQLRVAWKWRGPAPLFAPAAPLEGGAVAAAAVDGSVVALNSADGSQLWSVSVGSAVYAPLAAQPQTASLPHALLAGTQGGRLVALDGASGRRLWSAELGSQIAGIRLLDPAALPPSLGLRGAQQRCWAAVAVVASGVVALLHLPSWPGQESNNTSTPSPACVVDAVQLPSDAFAQPAAEAAPNGGWLVGAGCRDDHLYCFRLLPAM